MKYYNTSWKPEVLVLLSKRRCMEMVRKLMVVRQTDKFSDRWIFSLKRHSQERPGRVHRASDRGLGAEQIMFLDDLLEIYLSLPRRKKHNEKIKDV